MGCLTVPAYPISPSPGTPREGWGGGNPLNHVNLSKKPPTLPSPGVPGEGIIPADLVTHPDLWGVKGE